MKCKQYFFFRMPDLYRKSFWEFVSKYLKEYFGNCSGRKSTSASLSLYMGDCKVSKVFISDNQNTRFAIKIRGHTSHSQTRTHYCTIWQNTASCGISLLPFIFVPISSWRSTVNTPQLLADNEVSRWRRDVASSDCNPPLSFPWLFLFLRKNKPPLTEQFL